MKYEVKVGDRVWAVTCDGYGAETVVTVEGDERAITWWQRRRGGVLFVRHGNTTRAVRVSGSDATHVRCEFGGVAIPVEVIDEREARLRNLGELAGIQPQQGETIVAPMPGRVVSVLVDSGQTVGADVPVVVVEAMKMENEIRTTVGGTVAEIAVRPGDTVDLDQVLIRLE